jgi:hypothetical protein
MVQGWPPGHRDAKQPRFYVPGLLRLGSTDLTAQAERGWAPEPTIKRVPRCWPENPALAWFAALTKSKERDEGVTRMTAMGVAIPP